jgi:membrane protein involved in colicin uptake
MQELEEDPDMRSQINLYKDEEAIEAKAQREAAIAAERARAAQRMAEAQAAAEANDAVAAAAAQAAAQQAMVQAQMAGDGADYDADDNDEDDDFPDVGLEELLDDLTLGGDGPIDEGEEGESSATVAPAPVTFAPAGVAGPSEDQFALPGGNANATFHF